MRCKLVAAGEGPGPREVDCYDTVREAGCGLGLVTPHPLARPDSLMGGWSGLMPPHPCSCCQLADLLSGWLSLQVGEAVISHGAFPDFGETARKTYSPQRHYP